MNEKSIKVIQTHYIGQPDDQWYDVVLPQHTVFSLDELRDKVEVYKKFDRDNGITTRTYRIVYRVIRETVLD